MKPIKLFAIGIMAACTLLTMLSGCSSADPSPDYVIYVGNDTLTIMDSSITVKRVPYSDTSDLWRIVMEDNR
jgi:hypothetical protein